MVAPWRDEAAWEVVGRAEAALGEPLAFLLLDAPPEALETDFGQGVAMIRRQFDELWKKYGVTEVDTSGMFDPNVHEAVATEPTDREPKDAILDVLRKGYYLNDKLLRPALVKVAVPVTKEE